MKNVFCNIVDGIRVRSGMCACAHLHRSMLAHIIICFVGSALLGAVRKYRCFFRDDIGASGGDHVHLDHGINIFGCS